jgi:imidazoleglycerol-phosphate dehydratase/histidinol-phosphatase
MKVLFIDRDGTLVDEPPDEQVDQLEKIHFAKHAIPSLLRLKAAGFRFVMVSNQDGLGTASFPQVDFEQPQTFILRSFASQGIEFDRVFICPHRADDGCACRKPKTGLLDEWLTQLAQSTDGLDSRASAVIGDRDTDLALAENLGVRGLKFDATGTNGLSWPEIATTLLARSAHVIRETRETAIDVRINLDASEPLVARTGIGFFDHMLEQLGKHAGISLQLRCDGDLQVDEHHTIEDCALALGEALREALGPKIGIARYGFVLPMDESRAQATIDLSGRAYSVFEGQFGRDQVGGMPTELVPHFFRSLADSLGAAVHISVTGDNTHHMIEACFKATGRALRMAIARQGDDLPTTKGKL